jgi:hypothetical protein
MPTEWFVNIVERAITSAGITQADVSGCELYDLEPAAMHSVMDQVVAGHEFPMVLVGNRVACVGGVNADAVLDAIGQA